VKKYKEDKDNDDFQKHIPARLTIQVRNTEIEQVTKFRYLGSTITDGG